MQKQDSATPTAAATPRNGVLVLTGYGVRVAVERGHLAVGDGRGRERRAGRFSRADRTFRRLVVLGHTGAVTFDALRWLRDTGRSFAQIDADGVVVAAFAPEGVDDARLRRAQVLAATNGAGLTIARDLLRQKLAGQAAVLDEMERAGAGPAAATVRRCGDALDGADTPDALRWLEADAASIYFVAWSGIPVRWSKQDVAKVPTHWHAFGSRRSPLSGSTRRAADPINALLNYAYSVLETETRVALLAVGLDPGIGLLHADQRGRDSLVLDVMEPVRADVDRWVLGELERRTFAPRDLFETVEGSCRLMPPLAKSVAETALRWAALVAPVAEKVARLLAAGVRAASDREPARVAGAGQPAGCLLCGLVLESGRRRYCDECLPRQKAVVGAGDGRAALERVRSIHAAAGGRAALAKMRTEGRDPAHGGEAAERRGRANTAQMAAVAKWDRDHGDADDGADFARDVLPGLAGVPLARMATATGLSHSYCSFIRRGLKEPHRRHWAALQALAVVESGVVS